MYVTVYIYIYIYIYKTSIYLLNIMHIYIKINMDMYGNKHIFHNCNSLFSVYLL